MLSTFSGPKRPMSTPVEYTGLSNCCNLKRPKSFNGLPSHRSCACLSFRVLHVVKQEISDSSNEWCGVRGVHGSVDTLGHTTQVQIFGLYYDGTSRQRRRGLKFVVDPQFQFFCHFIDQNGVEPSIVAEFLRHQCDDTISCVYPDFDSAIDQRHRVIAFSSSVLPRKLQEKNLVNNMKLRVLSKIN